MGVAYPFFPCLIYGLTVCALFTFPYPFVMFMLAHSLAGRPKCVGMLPLLLKPNPHTSWLSPPSDSMT